MKLIVRYRKRSPLRESVYINGHLLKMKKIDGYFQGECLAEKGTNIELRIKTLKDELDSKHWFWWAMLFHFLTFLSLFDCHNKKQYYFIDSVSNFVLEKDETIDLAFCRVSRNGPAIKEMNTNLLDNDTNKFQINPKIKGRRIGLFFIKLATWFLLGVIVALIIIF